MMSETEAFYPAKPSDRDKGGFDLAEKNGWLTCSTARSLINPGADANFWKCDLCDQKKKEATRSIAYDQYKSHLLRCHDDQDSSPPGTLTPAETCFPVSTAKHRAKNAVKSEGKEVAKAAKTAETVPLLPTLADAYDALVAAGFTATAGEIKVLSTEVKKRIAREHALAVQPAKKPRKQSELDRLQGMRPPRPCRVLVPHVKTSGAACLVEVKPVKRSGRLAAAAGSHPGVCETMCEITA